MGGGGPIGFAKLGGGAGDRDAVASPATKLLSCAPTRDPPSKGPPMPKNIASRAVVAGFALSLAILPLAVAPSPSYAAGLAPDQLAVADSSDEPARRPAYSGPLTAYAVNVGNHDELGGYRTWVIRTRGEWDAFRDSMAYTVWTSTSGRVSIPVDGLGEYPDSFFDSGRMLAVAYSDLGSGSYNPYLTDVHEDGESLSIRYDIPEAGELVTCDMSGFVAVVELPATSMVSDIVMTDAAATAGTTASSVTDASDDRPTDTPDGDSLWNVTPMRTTVTVWKSLSLESKGTAYLNAYASDENGNGIARGTGLRYSTSNAKVATVSKDGKVTARLPGKAVIEVSYPRSDEFLPSAKKMSVTVTKRKVSFSKCSARNVMVPLSKVRRKAVTVAPIKAPKTVYAKSGVTYAKKSGPSFLKVDSKTGKVLIQKGAKKGTYTMTVRASSRADSYCAACSQTLRFKVVIR